MMTLAELSAAVALRDRLAQAGQGNTPQFQALQTSILAELDAKGRAASMQLFGKFVVVGGLAGALVGGLLGAAVKGALIGAVGTPLLIGGAAALMMKGMT